MTKRLHWMLIAGGIAIGLSMPAFSIAQGPRSADGRPDLSGVWRSASDRYLVNLAAGGLAVPFQDWSAALYKQRQASKGKGKPSDRCLPRGIPGAMLSRDRPWKLVQTPGEIVILFDELLQYRQIHTDGRGFPPDAGPTWFGYSVGTWDGDSLRVESTGFNDETWLDDAGHPHSEALRVIERFWRRNTGTLDVDITIDDLKAYTKPWTTTVRFERVSDTDLGEHICGVKPGS